MTEPGEGQSIPTQETSSPVYGWTIVDGKNVYNPTPAEQEARRILDHRKSIVKPLLDRFISDAPEAEKPLEFFLEGRAKLLNKTIDEMNEEEKGDARYLFGERNKVKEDLINRFAATKIPQEDLDQFITISYQVGKEMVLPGQEVNIDIMDNFIYTSESLDRAKLYQELALEWKEKYLSGINEEEAKRRVIDFQKTLTDLSGANIYPRPHARDNQEMISLFDGMTDVFDYAYSISAISISSFSGGFRRNASPPRIEKLIEGSKKAGLNQHDPAQIRRVLDIFKNTGILNDESLQDRFLETVYTYASKQPLSDVSVQGFLKGLLPAMQAKDPQVDLLQRSGNVWGMGKDFGAADFICHSYATEVTPPGINQLLMRLRQVPTTNEAKLEQNRTDAYAIGGALRELVHDQRPYAHDIMVAMLDFYETGDKKLLGLAISKARTYEKGGWYNPQFDEIVEWYFNREHYQDEIAVNVNGQEKKVKLIDLLKRLVENTEPISDLPPQVSDPELSVKLQRLTNKNIGETASREILQSTLDYINSRLKDMMGKNEVGIEPNYIQTLAWVDRKVFEQLQSLTYEDQTGAYKQDWFISILQFQELTSSPKDFDKDEFDNFIQQLKGSSSSEQAYKLIGMRILLNINTLARKYKHEGIEDVGALWSGNTSHELIGLINPRSAETEQGRKRIKEYVHRQQEPGYHPGD